MADLMQVKNDLILKTNKYITDKKIFPIRNEVLLETLEKIKVSQCSDEILIEALETYYDFVSLLDVSIAIDPRMNMGQKTAALQELRRALDEGNLSSESLGAMKKVIEECVDRKKHRFKYWRESRKFHKSHPGAKF